MRMRMRMYDRPYPVVFVDIGHSSLILKTVNKLLGVKWAREKYVSMSLCFLAVI